MLLSKQKEILSKIKSLFFENKDLHKNIIDDMENMLTWDTEFGNDRRTKVLRTLNDMFNLDISKYHITMEQKELIKDFCRLHLYRHRKCFNKISDKRKLNTYGWYQCNTKRNLYDNEAYCGHCFKNMIEKLNYKTFNMDKYPYFNSGKILYKLYKYHYNKDITFVRFLMQECEEEVLNEEEPDSIYCEHFYCDTCVEHNDEFKNTHVCWRYFVSHCKYCNYDVIKINEECGSCYYFTNVLNELSEFNKPLKKVDTNVVDFNNFKKDVQYKIILQESDEISRECYKEAKKHWYSNI